MLTILFQRNGFTWLTLQARDWHPHVALAVLYLIADAIAPAFGL